MIRTMIPKKIDRPCLFYVKQGDMSFRGDWSIMMQDNRPKPTFNMARIFNSLSGEWVKISGGDDDVLRGRGHRFQTRSSGSRAG